MRKIPCRSGSCGGRPALQSKSPDVFLTIERLSSARATVKCARCGRTFQITAAEVKRLPRMTDAELKQASSDMPNRSVDIAAQVREAESREPEVEE